MLLRASFEAPCEGSCMLFTSQARPAGSVASPSRRVLLSAYACEPGKGSEPGAGWLWALAAARSAEVWVLTRANNRTAIEADPAGTLPSLHFVYLDLPPSVLRWKRDGQWVRMYYLLWQFLA